MAVDAGQAGMAVPDDVAEKVDNALAQGKPVVVGYVDARGRPRLSLRGSTHVHDRESLALWVRHADGDLVTSVRANPQMCLLYRDSQERTTFVFQGRGRVAEDEATRRAVFEAIPQAEKDHDPQRHGVALIVDLDRLTGGTVGGRQVSLARD